MALGVSFRLCNGAVPKGGDWAEGSKEGVIGKVKRDRVMGESKKNQWGQIDVAKMSKPDDCLQVDEDVLR